MSECIPIFKFFKAVSKTAFHQISFKTIIRMFNLNCFNTIWNFILISRKMCKEMKPRGIALCWPCAPRQDQGQSKWYIMLEVNGTYKYDRNEKYLVEKFVCNCPMSKVTVFAMEDSRPAEHNSSHRVTWQSYGLKRNIPVIALLLSHACECLPIYSLELLSFYVSFHNKLSFWHIF